METKNSLDLLDAIPVKKDTRSLDLNSKATFDSNFKMESIYYPSDIDQIIQLQHIARKFKKSLHFISAGFNWGYGSRLKPKANFILVCLNSFKKISDFDSMSGQVTIEPGVSFHDLNKFLSDRSSDYYIPVPGSTSKASVLANHFQKGIAPSPDGYPFSRIIKITYLESGILKSVEIDNSLKNLKEHLNQRNAVDFLKLERNFCVVSIRIKLPKIPDYYRGATLDLNGDQDVGRQLTKLKQLKESKYIESSISFFNRSRQVASYFTKSEFDLLNSDQAKKANSDYSWSEWRIEFSVISNDIQNLMEKSRQIESVLDSGCILKWSGINQETPVFTKSEQTSLKLAYWKSNKNNLTYTNPDLEQCGLIWNSILCPFKEQSFSLLYQLLETHYKQESYDLILSIHAFDSEYMIWVVPILFDRDQNGSTEKAFNFYQSIKSICESKGFSYYREFPTELIQSGN